MKLGLTQNGYVGHIYDRKCKGSKDLPTATIRVKKAEEKTLQDVSNSWAADGGECEENSKMFLIFQQHNVSLRINLFRSHTATFVLCTTLPKDMTNFPKT